MLYTPTWTSTRTLPRIENGDLLGWLNDDKTAAAVLLRMGSETTYGTGDWLLSCPVPDGGTALLYDITTKTLWPAMVRVNDGMAHLFASTDDRPISSVHPFRWHTGCELRLLVGVVPPDWDRRRFYGAGVEPERL